MNIKPKEDSKCARRFALLLLWSAVVAQVLAASSVAAAEKYEVQVERNVAVKLRDGVTLRADIYRPVANGKFPVLLVRSPYDKAGELAFGVKAAARGYVLVAQDVRGRFMSEGDWYPFKYEAQDGYDTVEWAASLPYSNGKVGMYGGSYVGATQLLAAIARPPHLAGICPNFTASNYHDGWTYQGGAFEQWFNEWWTTYLAMNTMRRRVEEGADALSGTKTLPLLDYPVLQGRSTAGLAPYFTDWLSHPDYDDYWKQWSIEEHYAQIQVPVYSLGGWYDIFLGGTLQNFGRLKREAGSDSARHLQRLTVYVGGHAGGWTSRNVGAVDFGEKLPFDLYEAILEWYDALFKNETNSLSKEKPVKLFVMGRNVWREEDDWPLARARNTRYYLHSTAGANSLTGDGILNTDPPAQENPDQYIYDPNDPIPTIGGPLCCGTLQPGVGPQDQRPAEARHDVIVFTTPSFTQDTEVTGPVSMDLYVSSSAVDTDFTGKLVDVWPNGFAQNLTEGILRMRYRNSQEKPELANPAQTYRVTIDLWATSNVFLTGHKLRLEISSSNFPRFDRNLNTGEEQARGTRTIKATNMIYHDQAHPSALILPIVP